MEKIDKTSLDMAVDLNGKPVKRPTKGEKLLYINEMIANEANKPAIPGNLQDNGATRRVRCLIDSGAIQGNYIGRRVAKCMACRQWKDKL